MEQNSTFTLFFLSIYFLFLFRFLYSISSKNPVPFILQTLAVSVWCYSREFQGYNNPSQPDTRRLRIRMDTNLNSSCSFYLNCWSDDFILSFPGRNALTLFLTPSKVGVCSRSLCVLNFFII